MVKSRVSWRYHSSLGSSCLKVGLQGSTHSHRGDRVDTLL
jgi:hypothetical protein